MSGVVDPETIYTKQNCIGKLVVFLKWQTTTNHTGGGSFGKVYKG